MKQLKLGLAGFLLFAGLSGVLTAQEEHPESTDRNDPNIVFAYQGEAILTQAALDGAFSRIPEEVRLMFVRDGAKVDQLVKSLLQAEILALDADANGFSQDPIVQERVRLAARKELAEAWVEELLLRAPNADYAAMAKEDYLVNPEKYSTEATVDVTHILIGTENRLPSEAEAIVVELNETLQQDPAQFDALVMEYSDDPGKSANNGKYKDMTKKQLVKPFADVAFSMDTVGEISPPVETEFGFHLIRLDGKKEAVLPPFEQVKDQAELEMKQKHISSYQNQYMQRLLQFPVEFPQGSVEIMARRYFGENLENAPIFTEDGVIIEEDEQ